MVHLLPWGAWPLLGQHRLSWDPGSLSLSSCPRADRAPANLLGSEFGSEKQTDKRTVSLACLLAELSPQV